MSAVLELTDTLIKAGMAPAAAAMLVARAGVEMAPPIDTRSPGAKRQAAWRERNKASQNVTDVTDGEASQSVSDHNKTSQRDDASLSYLLTSSEKKLSEKKEKREAKRASQLPDGWRSSEAAWQASVALIGLERCELELKKFHRHAADKGRVSKNWNAAWGNWVEKAIEYGAKNGNRTGNTRTTGHDAILADALRAAGRLDRDDNLARTADAAGFTDGHGVDRSGPRGNPDRDGSAQPDHYRVEPDGGAIREGEIIPPDKNAAGQGRVREFVS